MKDINNYMLYMHVLPNNKIYIGITCKGVSRWGHNGDGYRNNKHFYSAIQKYGWTNIKHIILADNLSKEWASVLEQQLIHQYQSNDRLYGYNNSIGGEVNRGYHFQHSEETKQKLSTAISEWHKKPEIKLRLSEARRGYKFSEETRKRMSEAHKGLQTGANHPMYGKHHSEETKQKLREKNTGRIVSEETRKKLSDAHKGKKIPPEVGKKISEALTGKNLSETHKRRISEAKLGKPSSKKGTTLSEETKRKISEGVKRHNDIRKEWMV